MRNAAIAAFLQAIAVLLTRHAMNKADIDGSVAASIRLTTGTAALMLWGLLRGQLGGWLRQIFAPAARVILGLSALAGTFGGIWLNQLGIQWGTHTGVVTTLNSLTPIYQLPLKRPLPRRTPRPHRLARHPHRHRRRHPHGPLTIHIGARHTVARRRGAWHRVV